MGCRGWLAASRPTITQMFALKTLFILKTARS